MFRDKISIKGLAIGLAFYLIVSTVAMAIVVHAWLPPGITDRNELLLLTESDYTLLMWQSILGATLSVFAGFVCCHFSNATGLKTPLMLGVLFILYGVLGIYLHPTHPMAMQVGKILGPIPLTLLGGWLRLKLGRQASI